MQHLFAIIIKTEIICLTSKLVLIKSKNKKTTIIKIRKKRLIKFKKNNTIQNQKRDINLEQRNHSNQNHKKTLFDRYEIFKEALFNIKNWVNDSETKGNINSSIQKINFLQDIDSNNIDDIDKIQTDLTEYIKGSDFKNPNYWAEIIKDYFEKNNRLKDLKDFDNFMKHKKINYGNSLLLFFDALKEYNQIVYILLV